MGRENRERDGPVGAVVSGGLFCFYVMGDRKRSRTMVKREREALTTPCFPMGPFI